MYSQSKKKKKIETPAKTSTLECQTTKFWLHVRGVPDISPNGLSDLFGTPQSFSRLKYNNKLSLWLRLWSHHNPKCTPSPPLTSAKQPIYKLHTLPPSTIISTIRMPIKRCRYRSLRIYDPTIARLACLTGRLRDQVD